MIREISAARSAAALGMGKIKPPIRHVQQNINASSNPWSVLCTLIAGAGSAKSRDAAFPGCHPDAPQDGEGPLRCNLRFLSTRTRRIAIARSLPALCRLGMTR